MVLFIQYISTNLQLKVNNASTAAISSSMVIHHTNSTSVTPSSNSSSMMSSPHAVTTTAQQSFTLTPLGPHVSPGYGSMSGTGIVGSAYFPPGCASSSGRFGNTNQPQHSFDGPVHSTWTTPFGGPRTHYNGMPQFMNSQNQVYTKK